MELALLSPETAKELWFDKACQEYNDKISRFTPFEILRVKSPSLGRQRSREKIAAETTALMSKIKETDFVVLCDEGGKSLDSRAFSKNIVREIEGRPFGRMVFVVGGAFGIEDSVKRRSNLTVSLSPFVMNHLVAQVVLMEQIYRAMTIWKGIPYHND